MEYKVHLSEEDEYELLEKAKAEVREELTDDAVMRIVNASRNVPLIDFMREIHLSEKADNLANTMVKDLSRDDKLTLATRWLMLGVLV